MILIPELQTIVLLVPRTGSGSLRRAIGARYPKAIQLYRHMEADGVPQGYDRWKKIGVVREPVARLWSLYKFLQRFDGDHDAAYIAAQRASVDMPFSDWLVNNQTVFTSPYDSSGAGRFFPQFSVRHPLPETRKSQYLYLRPDLGTRIWPYRQIGQLFAYLDVNPGNHNATDDTEHPYLTEEAATHIDKWFAWDIGAA